MAFTDGVSEVIAQHRLSLVTVSAMLAPSDALSFSIAKIARSRSAQDDPLARQKGQVGGRTIDELKSSLIADRLRLSLGNRKLQELVFKLSGTAEKALIIWSSSHLIAWLSSTSLPFCLLSDSLLHDKARNGRSSLYSGPMPSWYSSESFNLVHATLEESGSLTYSFEFPSQSVMRTKQTPKPGPSTSTTTFAVSQQRGISRVIEPSIEEAIRQLSDMLRRRAYRCLQLAGSSRTSIHSLPVEVILQIAQFIQDVHRPTLARLARVSSRWYVATMGVLYDSVEVNLLYRTDCLAAKLFLYPHLGELVRTMTLNLHKLDTDYLPLILEWTPNLVNCRLNIEEKLPHSGILWPCMIRCWLDGKISNHESVDSWIRGQLKENRDPLPMIQSLEIDKPSRLSEKELAQLPGAGTLEYLHLEGILPLPSQWPAPTLENVRELWLDLPYIHTATLDALVAKTAKTLRELHIRAREQTELDHKDMYQLRLKRWPNIAFMDRDRLLRDSARCNLNHTLQRVAATLRVFTFEMDRRAYASVSQCIYLFGPPRTLKPVLEHMTCLERLVLPEQALWKNAQPEYDCFFDNAESYRKLVEGRVNGIAFMQHAVDSPWVHGGGTPRHVVHPKDGPEEILPHPTSAVQSELAAETQTATGDQSTVSKVSVRAKPLGDNEVALPPHLAELEIYDSRREVIESKSFYCSTALVRLHANSLGNLISLLEGPALDSRLREPLPSTFKTLRYRRPFKEVNIVHMEKCHPIESIVVYDDSDSFAAKKAGEGVSRTELLGLPIVDWWIKLWKVRKAQVGVVLDLQKDGVSLGQAACERCDTPFEVIPMNEIAGASGTAPGPAPGPDLVQEAPTTEQAAAESLANTSESLITHGPPSTNESLPAQNDEEEEQGSVASSSGYSSDMPRAQ